MDRNKSHGIKNFDLKAVLEYMYDFESGDTMKEITENCFWHNRNLRKDWQCNKPSIFFQKEGVSVRNNTNQYFMQDKLFVRIFLTKKIVLQISNVFR